MISLRHVSKRFKLFQRPADRVLEWCGFGTRHQDFWALKDIDLEVPRQRAMGIIGVNGAGKSTLLKMIAGTLLPTEGEIEIKGRIAALLELGTGFHPDFTGRQNIFVNGQLLGLRYDEIAELEADIISFSELGPFIDQPLRTYSSGMVVRLGFAIAASVNPEVLIVDEALSVGDARFSQKCTRRIQDFRDDGTTILFVSHDPTAISTLCDEVVLLEGGQIRSRGGPREMLDEYNALLAAKGSGNVAMRISRVQKDNPSALRRHGTFEAMISRLELLTEEGKLSDVYLPGECMTIRLVVNFLSPVEKPCIGILIKDRLGVSLFGTNTALKNLEFGPCKVGEAIELEMKLPLQLGYGDYHLSVAVHEDETHLDACYEWVDNAAIFSVRHGEKPNWSGLLYLQPEVKITRHHFEPDELKDELEERFPDLTDPLMAGTPDPSPFMSGFGRVGEGCDGLARRLLKQGSTFLFRPKALYLHLWIQTEGLKEKSSDGVEFTLTVVGKDYRQTCLLTEAQGILMFPLPTQFQDQLTVFQFESLAEQLPMAICQVASFDHPQESEKSWPIMMPMK